MTTIVVGDGKLYADRRVTLVGKLVSHISMGGTSTFTSDTSNKLFKPKAKFKLTDDVEDDRYVMCLGLAGCVDSIGTFVNLIKAYMETKSLADLWELFYSARKDGESALNILGLLSNGESIVGGVGNPETGEESEALFAIDAKVNYTIGSGAGALPFSKNVKEASARQCFLVSAYMDSSSCVVHDVFDLGTGEIERAVAPTEEEIIEAFKFLGIEGLYRGPKKLFC